jgi:hypothetical protein
MQDKALTSFGDGKTSTKLLKMPHPPLPPYFILNLRPKSVLESAFTFLADSGYDCEIR